MARDGYSDGKLDDSFSEMVVIEETLKRRAFRKAEHAFAVSLVVGEGSLEDAAILEVLDAFSRAVVFC